MATLRHVAMAGKAWHVPFRPDFGYQVATPVEDKLVKTVSILLIHVKVYLHCEWPSPALTGVAPCWIAADSPTSDRPLAPLWRSAQPAVNSVSHSRLLTHDAAANLATCCYTPRKLNTLSSVPFASHGRTTQSVKGLRSRAERGNEKSARRSMPAGTDSLKIARPQWTRLVHFEKCPIAT